MEHPTDPAEINHVASTYINTGGSGGWDRFGRTQNMRWNHGATLIEQIKYGYDKASQRTWRENPVAAASEDEFYSYDGLYQLTGRQRGDLNDNHTAIGGTPVRQETFDYDPIGNWQGYDVWQDGAQTLDQSRVHDTSNTLTQIDGSSVLLAHDAAGNMTRCPPDEAGAWSQSHKLKWDGWNRLEVRDASDNLLATYAYDGLWRRIRTTTASPALTTETWYNSQWRPVEEQWMGVEPPMPPIAYDWGIRYRDDLIRRVRASGSGYQTLYALHDYYNVTAIADDSGAVVERYGYSGFGDVRFMTPGFADRGLGDYGWNVLYKAQFRDAETGWYDYGYRYYVPQLGRWINRDPIGEQGGTNLFAFTGNNGVNNTDLLGLQLALPPEVVPEITVQPWVQLPSTGTPGGYVGPAENPKNGSWLGVKTTDGGTVVGLAWNGSPGLIDYPPEHYQQIAAEKVVNQTKWDERNQEWVRSAPNFAERIKRSILVDECSSIDGRKFLATQFGPSEKNLGQPRIDSIDEWCCKARDVLKNKALLSNLRAKWAELGCDKLPGSKPHVTALEEAKKAEKNFKELYDKWKCAERGN